MKRFTIVVAHRRAGKTVLAINTLIDSALRWECRRIDGQRRWRKQGTEEWLIGHPRYVYLAPLYKQAREVAWQYVKQFCDPIPGREFKEVTCTAVLPNGAVIQLVGADNPDALRGNYIDGVVIDEIANMKSHLWGKVLRPMLSDREGWCLVIGTPAGINLMSELFYRAIDDPRWATAVYTVDDTGEIPAAELEEMKKDMTEEEVAQELYCDFHASIADALIKIDLVRAAQKRRYALRDYDYAPKVMGVDPAWYGNDRHAWAKRQGIVGIEHKAYPGKLGPLEFANQVALEASRFKPAMIFIDVSFSPEVYHTVASLGWPAMLVNFGAAASDPQYQNHRAEMWWLLRDWVRDGAALPEDHELLADLCAPRYTLRNSHNKKQLESKDDMRTKRGLKSPDLADAYALTFAAPVTNEETRRLQQHARSSAAEHEYEPHAVEVEGVQVETGIGRAAADHDPFGG